MQALHSVVSCCVPDHLYCLLGGGYTRTFDPISYSIWELEVIFNERLREYLSETDK